MDKFTSIIEFEQAIPELDWMDEGNSIRGFTPFGYTKDKAYRFDIGNGYIDVRSSVAYGPDNRDGRYYYQDWTDGLAWIKVMTIFLATR